MTPARSFPYDTLVIAVGSESNDFGTPGVREHAVRWIHRCSEALPHEGLVNAYIRGHAQSARYDGNSSRRDHRRWCQRSGARGGAALTTHQFIVYGLNRIDRKGYQYRDSSRRPTASCRRCRSELSTAATKLLDGVSASVWNLI